MRYADDLPAILGGEPIRPQGPPEWPIQDEAVLQALRSAFYDGSWGRYLGGNVERLERRLASDWDKDHVLTCGSGTFAVELALRALRVAPGDEVVLAAYDYGGNFLSVHAVGARPILVDVDANNWNVSAGLLEAALRPQTRAILVSHLHGGLVPMREIVELASRRGIPVIEDAAQAPGARVQGRKVGSWGDVSVLSFGGSKLLTAGRGGAILTSDGSIAQRARLFVQRGNHVCPLSELQATVLLPQLDQLAPRTLQRNRAVQWLSEQLSDEAGLQVFRNRTEDSEPAYYKLGFQFDPSSWKISRDSFVSALRAEGIAFDAGFRAHHVGRSRSRWDAVGSLAEAERAHNNAVILHHPILLGSDEDLMQMVRAIQKIRRNVDRLA